MKRRKSIQLSDFQDQNDNFEKDTPPIIRLNKNFKSWKLRLCQAVIGSLVFLSCSIILVHLSYSFYSNLYVESDFLEENIIRSEIKALYQKHDRNDDGFLDIYEFEPLGHRLLAKDNVCEF